MSAQPIAESPAGHGTLATQPLQAQGKTGEGGSGTTSIATRVASAPRRPPEDVATLPTLVDVETLAAHLNVTVHHVRRLVQERRIPHIKIGTYVRFDPERVASWLAGECTVEAYTGPRRATRR